jgi:hypothetical protein
VFSFQADLKERKKSSREVRKDQSANSVTKLRKVPWKQNVIRMNPSNLKSLDSKAVKRAVAANRAVVANRKIGINRNVNANSASARSRVAEAKGAVVANRGVANREVANREAASKVAVNKAADDKPSWESQALGDCVLD